MSDSNYYIENVNINIFVDSDKSSKKEEKKEKVFDFFERAKELSKRKVIITDMEKSK